MDIIDSVFLDEINYNKNVKIDIVFTFVNPYDDNWRQKYNKYNRSIDKVRFDFSDDQIKFSIQTIEKFFPTVSKVYIVSDNQKFSLQDLSPSFRQKIIWIDHTDIIPKIYLPTFNSIVIEAFLWKIKNISNNFIYFNDDMFLGNYIDKDTFIDNQIIKQFYKTLWVYNHPWVKNIEESNILFNTIFNNTTKIMPTHAPYHLHKPTMETVFNLFYKHLEFMLQHHKVRSYKNTHNLIFLHAMYALYKGVAKNTSPSFSVINKLHDQTIKKLSNSNNRKQFYCFFRPVGDKDRELYDALKNAILL